MARKRVMVLYGGRADEHSISCISAANVLRAVDTRLFDPVPVGITRQGAWVTGGDDPRVWELGAGSLPEVRVTPACRPVLLDPALGRDGFFAGDVSELRDPAAGFGTSFVSFGGSGSGGPHGSLTSMGRVDAVFPVLHGPYGEDGTVQGLLEMMGVPYVGCGVFASAACMDKHFTKLLLREAGIPVTPSVTVDARRLDAASKFASNAAGLAAKVASGGIRYPVFVKPSRAGSSFGVSRVDAGDGPATLAHAVFDASHHDWKVLIEQGVQGREIECGVLSAAATGETLTSWPGEIVLDSRSGQRDAFYDFNSKYVDSSASHVEVPAKLPPEVLQRVRETAARAFRAVDGKGLCRVDTFVQTDGRVVVNEINTMPGFTSISMYPKAWKATGVPYTDLLTRLIEGVL